MPKIPIYLIIETDCEGKYCFSIPTDNKKLCKRACDRIAKELK